MEVKTHVKTVRITTEQKEYMLSFSPCQPRGYEEIVDALNYYESGFRQIILKTKGTKETDIAAGVLLLSLERETLEKLKKALSKVFGEREFAQIEELVDYIPIGDMIKIAAEVLASYTSYYKERLKGLEA